MSTVSYGLGLLAVLGFLALAVGTTAFAASTTLETAGSRQPSGDPGSCVSSAVRQALANGLSGSELGAMISDMAGCARPRHSP